eukprot:gb/GECG01016682.1/.p1 GENE.gb/GECG01016682.1/~~gb/GECG01016682.1/.p1  ORF type:complete len:681 (+),score=104.31 gb/GECG01016682.1/:1-2043(+)
MNNHVLKSLTVGSSDSSLNKASKSNYGAVSGHSTALSKGSRSSRNPRGPASSLEFFSSGHSKGNEREETKHGAKYDDSHDSDSDDATTDEAGSSGDEEGRDDETQEARFLPEDASMDKFRKRLGIKLYGMEIPSLYPDFNSIPKSIPRSILLEAARYSKALSTDQPANKVSKADSKIIQGLAIEDKKSIVREYKQMRHSILSNIESSEWNEPTPVQMQAIPCMLAGRDVLGVAPTGSGKTAAFMIPLILFCLSQHVGKSAKKNSGKDFKRRLRALVLVPTRELASQIQEEGNRLAEGTGVKISLLTKSVNAVEEGKQKDKGKQDTSAATLPSADILVCTPKRLQDMLNTKPDQLQSLRHVVMDECDRMLEFGLVEQVDDILSHCSDVDKASVKAPKIQRCMFSATLPENLENVSLSFLRDPIRTIIGKRGAAADSVDQKLLFVGREEGKLLEMRQMASGGFEAPMLVFVQSKERAKELYGELRSVFQNKLDVIHSDRSQKERNNAINKFRYGETWVLIATDLLCRGIDVTGVKCVINYDFPQSPTSYVHRVGRTGRAGMKGKAITFFTEDDIKYLRSIANLMRLSGCEVPEWMLEIKKPKRSEKRKMAKSAPKRQSISTIPSYVKRKEAHKRRMIKNSKEAKAQGKLRKKSSKQEGKRSANDAQDSSEWTEVPSGGMVPE